MAAARYSSDVLQMFYGPIPREEKINLPEPLKPDFTVLYGGFQISQISPRMASCVENGCIRKKSKQ